MVVVSGMVVDGTVVGGTVVVGCSGTVVVGGTCANEVASPMTLVTTGGGEPYTGAEEPGAAADADASSVSAPSTGPMVGTVGGTVVVVEGLSSGVRSLIVLGLQLGAAAEAGSA